MIARAAIISTAPTITEAALNPCVFELDTAAFCSWPGQSSSAAPPSAKAPSTPAATDVTRKLGASPELSYSAAVVVTGLIASASASETTSKVIWSTS